MMNLLWFLSGMGVGFGIGQVAMLLIDVKKHGWHNDR